MCAHSLTMYSLVLAVLRHNMLWQLESPVTETGS